MPTKWMASARRAKQLSVFADPSLSSNSWGKVLTDSIAAFNALMKQHGIGVTLVTSNSKPVEGGGADIAVTTASGAYSVTYADQKPSGTMDPRSLHGKIHTIMRQEQEILLEKAFIFVPLNPEVNTPQGSRATGAGVRKLIMVHELVHAAGLNGKNDHSTNDLFNGYPTVSYGATPDKDTVYVTFGGKVVHMPPLFLSSDTVKLLKPLW